MLDDAHLVADVAGVRLVVRHEPRVAADVLLVLAGPAPGARPAPRRSCPSCCSRPRRPSCAACPRFAHSRSLRASRAGSSPRERCRGEACAASPCSRAVRSPCGSARVNSSPRSSARLRPRARRAPRSRQLLRLHRIALRSTKRVASGSLCAASRSACARHLGRHALHLVEDPARLHDGHPLFRVALALAHAGLGGLLGDRLVREDADPDLAAALHVAGHRDARRLDLARGHARLLDRLQPVLAERRASSRGTPCRACGPSAYLRCLTFLGCSMAYLVVTSPIALRERALAQLAIGDVALEDPALHADHAVGGLRLGEAVVDLGAQRVQRHAPLAVPLAAAHLGAAEPARALDADARRRRTSSST